VANILHNHVSLATPNSVHDTW